MGASGDGLGHASEVGAGDSASDAEGMGVGDGAAVGAADRTAGNGDGVRVEFGGGDAFPEDPHAAVSAATATTPRRPRRSSPFIADLEDAPRVGLASGSARSRRHAIWAARQSLPLGADGGPDDGATPEPEVVADGREWRRGRRR
jgi:hypothetical protein